MDCISTVAIFVLDITRQGIGGCMPSLSELLDDVTNCSGDNSELDLITMGTPGSKRTREKQFVMSATT